MTPGEARSTILVVDDYDENREMYAEYLEFSGYRALQAADGMQAIETALAEMPSAILMDLALPTVDGWEATRRLKNDARTKGIPVIALTGHALTSHAQRARDAGCDLVLTKPCLPEEMLAALQRLLGEGTSSEATPAPAPKTKAKTKSPQRRAR